ncbi:hypothetical protein SCHPADRAFT_866284 [Schizopora paradoxa]|uniref:Uncharacterized protein n=1 Tax=Schizopora paradoxa TaxID=27342 RepID=A0A0H2S3T6_9AGAM|nr:hypothetical protein SCHPADRAFT_866284 [Schizopora paradoxa]
MVVIIEKDFVMPPPPYLASEHRLSTQSLASSVYSQVSGTSTSAPRQRQRSPKPFSKLPSHLVLYIVHRMLPDAYTLDSAGQRYTEEELSRRTTRTLYWMANSLRFVNRTFYMATMHILRSTYLAKYLSLIKKPYTSDPFPLSSQPARPKGDSFLSSMQRESFVLDLFLLFQLREDVFADESSLHLEREDSLRDLFSFMQPRARLEDLIRDFGCNAGLVYTSQSRSASNQQSSSNSRRQSEYSLSERMSTASLRGTHITPLHPNALPFESISISFSIRRIGIVLSSQGGRKRTIVEIPRDRSETLERCASHLIHELKGWADSTQSTRR